MKYRDLFDKKKLRCDDIILITLIISIGVILVFFRSLGGNKKMYMVGYKANKDNAYLIELFEAGKLKPVIDKCFPLAETADAFRYFGEGKFKGKIVITLGHNNEI